MSDFSQSRRIPTVSRSSLQLIFLIQSLALHCRLADSGPLLTASQARESGLAPISLLFFAVASCGMFAFLIAIGSFLGLIRSDSKLSEIRRRLLDSVAVACAMVPITLVGVSELVMADCWIQRRPRTTPPTRQIARSFRTRGVHGHLHSRVANPVLPSDQEKCTVSSGL